MTKLIFHRVQTVQIELLREPTEHEKLILLNKVEDENMFSLPNDIINWDDEEIIGEDYSTNIHVYIPENKLISK